MATRRTFILDKGWRDPEVSRDAWCIVTTGDEPGWYQLAPGGEGWCYKRFSTLLEALRANTELMILEPVEWSECGVPFRYVVEDNPEAVFRWLRNCRTEMLCDAMRDQWDKRLLLSSICYLLGEVSPARYHHVSISGGETVDDIRSLLEQILNESLEM